MGAAEAASALPSSVTEKLFNLVTWLAFDFHALLCLAEASRLGHPFATSIVF
jgi:hypothetical protein